MLTNPKSAQVKYFQQLKTRQKRTSHGKFMIEGAHLVEEALDVGMLDKVLYDKDILLTSEGRNLMSRIIAMNIPNDEASKMVIKHLSQVESPQGIIASVKPKIADLGDIFETEDPLIIVACGIQDPGNLGTIIRTAASAGCGGMILTTGTVDPYNDKVVRASSGSIFRLNIIKIDDIIEIISSLKRRGVKIIATVSGASETIWEMDYSGPTALLIGNEGAGIAQSVENLCDDAVSIPMQGEIESLNAAVSAAVILYEAVRQRRKSGRAAS